MPKKQGAELPLPLVAESYQKTFAIPVRIVQWCIVASLSLSFAYLLIVQGNLLIVFQSSTCPPIFFTVRSPLWHSFLRSQMRTMLLIPRRKQEVSEDSLLSFCYLSCLPLCMLLSFSMEKTRVSEDMYHLSLIYLLPFVLLLSSWSLIIIGCSFHRS